MHKSNPSPLSVTSLLSRRVLLSIVLFSVAGLGLHGAGFRPFETAKASSGTETLQGPLSGEEAVRSLRSSGQYDSLMEAVNDAAYSGAGLWSTGATGRTYSATGTASGDNFGDSIAISGDTVVVGAPNHDIGTEINQGAAYVFVRSGSTWSQQAKLTASDGAGGDNFGKSVSIYGDTIVVGSPRDQIGSLLFQGSAYVFTRSGTTWTQQAKLVTSDGAYSDSLGTSVSISGDTVALGAEGDDFGAVADRGSVYIFVRSGTAWSEQAKLVASDGGDSDYLGKSVSISGDSVIAGAYKADIGSSVDRGAAYVFTRSGSTWTEQQKLTAPEGQASDFFGSSVGISGDYAIVGAPGDDLEFNGDQGSAYIFTRSGTSWGHPDQVSVADGSSGDEFGKSVAISGNTATVGAYLTDVNSATNQGAVHVFLRTGPVWSGQRRLVQDGAATNDLLGASVAVSGDIVVAGASGDNGSTGTFTAFRPDQRINKLTASDGAAGNVFGTSVAISGNTAVVGAPLQDVGQNSAQGAAFVFVRSGTGWTQQAKVIASDGAASDQFGKSVAISGDTVVVGAPYHDTSYGDGVGAVYVFVRTGTAWTQQTKIASQVNGYQDALGFSVAISGDTLLAAAYRASSPQIYDQGAVAVWTRSGSTWTWQQTLLAADGDFNDLFGFSVSLSGDTAVVGAISDDTGSTFNQGSAYVFVRSGSTWSQQQKLLAPDGETDDNFGSSVSVSGDSLVVGMPQDNIGDATDQGSAYVFVRSGTTWSQQSKLTDTNGRPYAQFGTGVSIDGNRLVIGIPADSSSAAGSAILFTRSGTTWTNERKVTAYDGAVADFFGAAVAVSTEMILVGAPYADLGSVADRGAAYSFAARPSLSISGTVLQGTTPLSDATLTLSGDSELTGLTTSTGTYSFPDVLADGEYTVTPRKGDLIFTPANRAYTSLSSSQTAQDFSVLVCSFTLNSSSVTVSEAGSSGSVNFTANASSCPWTAVSNASWITFTTTTTGTGSSVVVFSVAPNTGPARSGTITVAGQTFTVNQPSGCSVSLGSSSEAFLAEGGSSSVSVTAGTGCPWTATSNVAWVTVTSSSSGSGNGTVSFTVAANTGSTTRTGTISIGGRTFTVDQAAPCDLSMSPSTISPSSAGGSFTINVTSRTGCAWGVLGSSNWITVTSGSTGSGNGTVSVSVAANTGPARSSAVIFGNADLIASVTVNQASGCTFVLGSSSASAAAAGESLSVSVTADTGCTWSASSNVSWITVTSGSSGSGNGTVGLTVAANTGAARSGTVTIGGQTFTVNQGAACSYTVSPTGTQTVASAGGNVVLTVTTTSECTWSSGTETAWIVVATGQGGMGNGTVTLAVSANTGPLRTGTASVAGQTVTIEQAAGSAGSVAGTVRYYFGSTPAVGGVNVTGSGTTTVSATTDLGGGYRLENFSSGPYSVSVSKTGQVTGISSLDASRAAQYAANLITLTPNQIVAADATNNGSVSSLDASRIAQTAAGIANTGIAGTWKFVPPTRSYSSVTSALTGEDYTAILVGDVTGNWTPPITLSEESLLEDALSKSGNPFPLAIRGRRGQSGEHVRIPVTVGDITNKGITAFDIELSYDPEVLEPVIDYAADNSGTLSANLIVTTNLNTPGRLIVSAYGIAPISGEGTLLNLLFRVKGKDGARTRLKFERMLLNEERHSVPDGVFVVGRESRGIGPTFLRDRK